MPNKLAVVAIGGNSLIKDKDHQSISDQLMAVRETCVHIAAMIQYGWNVVLTHGNGPQVGFALRRSELAAGEIHEIPLDVCGADTQGSIGYMLQQSLYNEFQRRNMRQQVVTVVSQVLVDSRDPAFENPSKPIGSFLDERTALRKRDQEGWTVSEDAGRGWRRVVASPNPMRIVEQDAIKALIERDFVVIAVGGGGIPVIETEQGELQGIAAVIDKDHASALLAIGIGADLFLLSTTVEKVAINFCTPNIQWLDQMTIAEAKRYRAENHFKPGSMLPKINAVISFLEGGGKEAVITTPENIERALAGESGTRITP